MKHASYAVVLAIAIHSVGSLAADIEEILKQPIIGPVLTATETQAFCESRIVRMTPCKSAEAWQAESQRLRTAVLEEIVYRGTPADWRKPKTTVQWLDTIEGGPGYRIEKFRYEVLPGLWTAGLLYVPDQLSGKVPVVLNVNGHSPQGKAYVPKQIRCINQAKRGMLAMNLEWIGMGQLRTPGFDHFRMNQLDLCGQSGLAPFYLCLKRGLDILLSHPHADLQRVGVTGLSGGGWQTIMISSLDERVTLCNPVAGYSSLLTRTRHHKDIGDSEQIPNDLATIADYTHLTAMLAPRPLLLTYNSRDDCCFESGYALQPMLDAAEPIFELFKAKDALRWHINDDPGTHNYGQDNRQASYRFLGKFFFSDLKDYDPKEIPCQQEIKTANELFVELPAENHDFHTLALAASEQLPQGPPPPNDPAAATAWRRERLPVLRKIVRARDYRVTAVKSGARQQDDIRATSWRLKMEGPWTIPAVELVQGDPRKTAILVADKGRASAAADALRLLQAGYRVIAVDPINLGECASAGPYDMMIACVGERLLGLQASQLNAVARWAAEQHETGPVTFVARGPRSSVAVLVAAALEPTTVGQVELHDSPTSLKQVIQRNWSLRQAPELFCFGLLKEFDITYLAAMAPNP